MADLTVIVPSRGRPQAARELAEAFDRTCTTDTRLVLVVDEDDPTLPEYSRLVAEWPWDKGLNLCRGENLAGTMVFALNGAAAVEVNLEDGPAAIGFMGDDHRPRTVGWDQTYLAALDKLGSGIVYGDDGYQGERLPTQCAMTADIVRALGWMAPPMLRHMYVDDFWRDLGQAAGCLRYLPNVLIEHMHPIVGKAPSDPGYERVNAPEAVAVDAAAYDAYQRSGGFAVAVRRVRDLRQPPAGDVPQLGAFNRQPASRGAYPATPVVEDGEQHEWRLFDEGTVPEYTRPDWYAGRDHAPHLEQEGHRDRLLGTATFVAQAAFTDWLSTVVDLGAGDGGLLSLLGPALTAWGYDLMPANLDAAKERGVDVRYGDVVGACGFANGYMRELGDPTRTHCALGADHAPGHRNAAGDEIGEGPGEPDAVIEWGDIAVCTEMLEHLVDPHGFVRRIAEHARALVCSSPRLERPGNAYEFHTWAWDLIGYRALVEQGGFKVLRQRVVGPFQVMLAVRR